MAAINVYYGGADRARERFMFDRIADTMPADTILLVPDQFTLQAERNAFEFLRTDTLLDLEIMSPSSLAREVMATEGSPAGVPVDKYGRYMLLAGLMIKDQSKDGLFAAANRRPSFIGMLSDFISGMKQNCISPKILRDRTEALTGEDYLKSKLEDLTRIYEDYQNSTEGSFLDTEDLQNEITLRIPSSKRIASTNFWMDGFDYMAPNMLAQMEAIAASAPELNVMLTWDGSAASDSDAFAMASRMRRLLKEAADRRGIPYKEEPVPESYRVDKSPAVKLIKAADFYCEAESVAIEITKFVREHDMRYRDIVIICNDAEKRGSVFRRVFDTYGIPLFIDRRKVILQDPAVEYIFSLLDAIRHNRRLEDVFRLLKTGYGPVDDEMTQLLEVYCRKYNIRGGRWKKDFIYGVKDEGQERLAGLNEARASVEELFAAAEDMFKGKKTVREKALALYSFLSEKAELPEKIAAAAERLEKRDRLEEAGETLQIWKSITELLDQIVEVLGDEEITDDDFTEILREGFSEKEIGLIPPNNDLVLFGTMQRTRTGSIKALFIAGANEGVLPENSSTDGLLSEEEIRLISDQDITFGKTAELKSMEQKLALYRNLHRAESHIFVSWADMNLSGESIRPSELIEDIRNEFPEAETVRDCISSRDYDLQLQNSRGSLPHIMNSLREYLKGDSLEDIFKAAVLISDGRREFETAKKGLFYKNEIEKIEKDIVRELYGRGAARELILSTSAIERYARCPFSFLISGGLRPDEQRSFEVDVRSIGDIYHECLRRISDELSADGIEITAPESKWMTVTAEEVRGLISGYADEYASGYREGVFGISEREIYVKQRIKDICFEAAWLMIGQIRSGKVKAVYFEQRFANRADALFPPVMIELKDGNALYIEGIIDRVDVIAAGDGVTAGEGDGNPAGDGNGAGGDGTKTTGKIDGGYIRVVDYKSGNETFDLEEVLDGWRLQLMIYLKGAMGAIKDSKPAGVFYFAVKEPLVDVSEISDDQVDDKAAASILSDSRLDGVAVNDPAVLEGIDSTCEPGKSSTVMNMKLKLDGDYAKSKSLLTDAEFKNLIDVNDANLSCFAESFAGGSFDIAPKKGTRSDACRFCSFRSICCKEC